MTLKVTLGYDRDCEPPNEAGDGQWTLYSFNTHHHSYKHPLEVGLMQDGKDGPTIGLRRKLAVGTAFLLSYYEHSGCVWSLRGQGPRDLFDSVDVAGVLVWENPVDDLGPKTYEERKHDAALFLAVYTAWANGECYYYDIENDDDSGEEFYGCGGFYGSPDELAYMFQNIADEVGDREVEFTGEASYLADSYWPVQKLATK